MQKVLVFGANGLLGRELCKKLGESALPVGHDECDICEKEQVEAALKRHRPDIIVNCAAATDVDRCERDIAWAYTLNARAPAYIAAACTDTPLIHISTDYVFDGTRRAPYLEGDTVAPLSIYGKSKLVGECCVLERGGVVIRTQWLYGEARPGFIDFVLTQAKKGVVCAVDNATGCPTWTGDVAEIMCWMLGEKLSGIYHIANTGSATWLDFAEEILFLSGIDAKVKAITTDSLARAAPRPAYSVLGNTRLPEIRCWQDALRHYMEVKR